jgi:hypothetical protein
MITTRYGTPDIPAAVAALRCRCCSGELEVIYQMGLLPHHSALWLVTCPNVGGCRLAKQTLEASNYPTKDLSDYGFIPTCDKQASTEPTN